jgi:hypothetical protein
LNINETEDKLCHAIARLEQAKPLIIKSLNLCVPGMVGMEKLREIQQACVDLVEARECIRLAEVNLAHAIMDFHKIIGGG